MTLKTSLIRRCLVLASASFLSMTLICMLLHPQIFTTPTYGISAFGAVQRTLIPYYLGFAITTVCLAVIAHHLRSVERRLWPLQMAFWIAGGCMAGLALTSYGQSLWVFTMHMVLSFILVGAQLAAAGWIVMQVGARPLDYGLFALFVAVVIISIVPAFYTNIPVLYFFPVREVLVFVSSLGLIGRMALRVTQTSRF